MIHQQCRGAAIPRGTAPRSEARSFGVISDRRNRVSVETDPVATSGIVRATFVPNSTLSVITIKVSVDTRPLLLTLVALQICRC